MEYGELDEFLYAQGFVSGFEEMTSKIQEGTGDSLIDLIESFGQIFILNLGEIKGELLQLLGISLLFSLLIQLSKAYGRGQLEKYGYYIYFVSGATICLTLFYEGYETVAVTVSAVISFMEVLAPAYSVALIVSNGTNTSATYYGLLILILFFTQWLMMSVFLPGTKIYMAFRFVNEGIGDKLFSKFQKLLEDAFSWGLKGLLVGICSISTIQSLIAPTLDKVRRISAAKTVSIIPGIGSLAGSATEILLSSGILLKNSMGIVSVMILLTLCAPGIIKILAIITGLRVLEVCMEPFMGDKTGGLLDGCYKSLQMLLKIQIHTLMIFSVCLVILTSFS